MSKMNCEFCKTNNIIERVDGDFECLDCGAIFCRLCKMAVA